MRAVTANSQLNRVRRQLLRGAVDENLDTINGHPIGSMRRDRQRRTAKMRRALMVSIPVAVSALSMVVILWSRDVIGGAHQSPAGPHTAPVASRISIPAPDPQPDQIVERMTVSSRQPLVPDIIPVTVGRVALDPGHGGVDGGTSMGYGLLEKDLTKDIANRVGELLKSATWEVVMTRHGDESVSLKHRAEIANSARADLFLSIHVNWLPDRTARGFETYFLGPTEDPFLRRLATYENRDSGYALADYRQLLQGIYADVRHDQSQELAASIQKALFDTLSDSSPDIVSRGVMTAPFAVLVTTEMPAVLVEVACLSNDREARLLALPSYRQQIADALFGAITGYARQINSPSIDDGKGS
jgi:N-acetylmuramoyl-L-alanine amidase